MLDLPAIDGDVLVATGLALEARIAAGPGIVTVCSGGDPSRLRSLLAASDLTVCAVISFGLAGGVDPALRAGNLVIATEVISGTTSWPVDKTLMWALTARLAGDRAAPVLGRVAGSDAIVSDPATKAILYGTGIAAVDMESHVAAEFAAAHRLPFGVVRVICDPAGRALPPLAQHALGMHGGIRLPSILGSLARDPSQISALVRLGRDFATAVRILRRSRRLLGRRFGVADAGELVLDVT
jgi:hopanoid-associated phosphorylase